MTQNTLPSPPARQHISWLLALPKFGIVLLMLALMALLWLLQNSEKEEQRNLLIKDVLWLEQNLRFHMEGNRDLLQQIAVDMSDSEDKENLFRVRSAHLLKNSPEISQIRWLDKAQKQMLTLGPEFQRVVKTRVDDDISKLLKPVNDASMHQRIKWCDQTAQDLPKGTLDLGSKTMVTGPLSKVTGY
mgnify:CR=1 FL=1